MQNAHMEIYDTRRVRLKHLIIQLEMSYAAFGALVGYNGAYIGQLVNGTKRSSGGKAIVTDKVIGKILAKIKARAPDVTREWFDQPIPEPAEVVLKNPRKRTTTVTVVGSNEQVPGQLGEPAAPLIDDEKFPEHLSSTWPYMNEEQRAALRYLEAGFRAQRNRNK